MNENEYSNDILTKVNKNECMRDASAERQFVDFNHISSFDEYMGTNQRWATNNKSKYDLIQTFNNIRLNWTPIKLDLANQLHLASLNRSRLSTPERRKNNSLIYAKFLKSVSNEIELSEQVQIGRLESRL